MLNDLNRSAEKLAEAERIGAYKEMAKQIAHEIKNPLTPMLLSMQFLKHKAEQNSLELQKIALSVSKTMLEQLEMLTTIATNFGTFEGIVYDFLDFDIHEFLHSLILLFKTNTEINFVDAINSEKVFINGDKNNLMRCFHNILKNAVEATEGKKERTIYIESVLLNNEIFIYIKDNGKGIKEDFLEKIFDLNFTDKNFGMGLGLPISREIIHNHKGTITCTSILDIETIFIITFPIISQQF